VKVLSILYREKLFAKFWQFCYLVVKKFAIIVVVFVNFSKSWRDGGDVEQH